MSSSLDIAVVIERLGLIPHPEGGYFRETFRSAQAVPTPRGKRSASTLIHFALKAGTFSAWHRVESDETWHLYGGGPAELHLFDGEHRIITLGTDLAAGEVPQAVVPAGVWQATAAGPTGSWFGCTVAPGFEFDDFQLASRALVDAHPGHRAILERFIR